MDDNHEGRSGSGIEWGIRHHKASEKDCGCKKGDQINTYCKCCAFLRGEGGVGIRRAAAETGKKIVSWDL